MSQPKGCSQSALLCEYCPPVEEYVLKSSLLPAWWAQPCPEQDCTAMAAMLPNGVPMLMTLLDRCAVSPETAHTVIRAPAIVLQKRLYRLPCTNSPTPQELIWRPDDVMSFGKSKCSLHMERIRGGTQYRREAFKDCGRKGCLLEEANSAEGKDAFKRGGK